MLVPLRALVAAAALAAVLASAGCHLHRAPGRGHGPPPHAPAHGYRHHHAGHELVFDAHRGVYVVVGVPDLYFRDGRFYRHRGGTWERAAETGGPWSRVSKGALPPGLAKKGGPPGRGKRGR
ncbi:MAG: hypothetical protein R3263_01650 [Myxococcota bacterium]|nr:hypothetical protein [Myxococcota bacterium]